MSTDQVEEPIGRTVTTSGTQIEGRLLRFEERMLRVEEKYLRQKESLWEVEEVFFRQNEEFFRKKEEFLREKYLRETESLWEVEEEFLRKKEEFLSEIEEIWTKKVEFYRQRDRRLEESRLKLDLELVDRILGSEEPSKELLPGISNDIALNEISTKLSRREFQILTLASRGWYNAIRNHQVYDARVRSHSTQTFVVVLSYSWYTRALALHCLRDNYCFQLPPILHLRGGIEDPSRCIAVDGKIYILGGAFDGPSDEVYVLDLAGQRPWTRCASMQQARHDFGCGVMDGKIYVFGGKGFNRCLCESEVYDPKKNTWSTIMPMLSSQRAHQVAVVGKELLIYGGEVYTDDNQLQEADLEIYHPVRDDWIKAKPCPFGDKSKIFVANEKLCWINRLGIHVHDFDENSWTLLYSHRFPALDWSANISDFYPTRASAVDGEVLASGYFYNSTGSIFISCVFRSIGFNSDKKYIEWQLERGWFSGERIERIFPIQL